MGQSKSGSRNYITSVRQFHVDARFGAENGIRRERADIVANSFSGTVAKVAKLKFA
jgi:hypothetical protein